MKTCKKLLQMLFVLAIAVILLAIPNTNAKAATTRNTTFTVDSKTGIVYPTATRAFTFQTYNSPIEIYLKNEGDYISSVKAGKGLVCKKTTKTDLKKGNYTSLSSSLATELKLDDKQKHFCVQYNIGLYSEKPGNYTLTYTVKNKNKKKVGTYRVKVYVRDSIDGNPIRETKYAGTNYGLFSEFGTKKASGKLQLKMNKDFSLKSIEVGYADGTNIKYKKIRNNSKIDLAKTTIYKEVNYSSGEPTENSYYYESGSSYNYLKPATFVKVTYYDKLLKITDEKMVYIFNIK